ncbi:MFS transporter, partial [Streptomyces sp. SID625]|nr:MFS transporter [Streptomyces sp. SID625]
GWPATAYDIRTPLHAATLLLLAMTPVTASMTSNRRVEAALHAAAPADGPDHSAAMEPAEKSAPGLS